MVRLSPLTTCLEMFFSSILGMAGARPWLAYFLSCIRPPVREEPHSVEQTEADAYEDKHEDRRPFDVGACELHEYGNGKGLRLHRHRSGDRDGRAELSKGLRPGKNAGSDDASSCQRKRDGKKGLCGREAPRVFATSSYLDRYLIHGSLDEARRDAHGGNELGEEYSVHGEDDLDAVFLDEAAGREY